MARKYLVAGNWKMYGSTTANQSLMTGLLSGIGRLAAIEVLVCPPAPYLASVRSLVGEMPIRIGAQNLADQGKEGAFTGEVLGAMLRDVGCTHVIVGHSERRALYGESDAVVAEKVRLAIAQGLVPIFCVGETLAEREAGATDAVIIRQMDAMLAVNPAGTLDNLVVAYEPVWAIGTGRTATPEQAQTVHAAIRQRLAVADAKLAGSTRILYGGSVKPDNAAAIFAQPDVDGGLVGGASLKAADFLAICEAAQAQKN